MHHMQSLNEHRKRGGHDGRSVKGYEAHAL